MFQVYGTKHKVISHPNPWGHWHDLRPMFQMGLICDLERHECIGFMLVTILLEREREREYLPNQKLELALWYVYERHLRAFRTSFCIVELSILIPAWSKKSSCWFFSIVACLIEIHCRAQSFKIKVLLLFFF